MSDGDITLTADEWTVHAREKVSTGDYENGEYHVSISGSVEGVAELDDATRKELKARLLGVEKEALETVERTASNRLSEPEFRDWGVSCDE